MSKKNTPGCGSCCDEGPCTQICPTVKGGCDGHVLEDATVTQTQGATVTGPCTTGSDGRCCNVATSGAFSLEIARTGYVTKTVTGTALCPPPPTPVTYGPRYAGTLADDATIGTGVWTNPGNAGAADAAFATAPSNSNTPTHYLKGTASGSFAIPTGGDESIYRIRLEVGAKAGAAASDYDARLVLAGTIGATNKALGSAISTGSTAILSYAWTAPGDLPTIAQANAGDIGFAFAAKAPGASTTPSLAHASTMATGTSAAPTVAITSTTAGNFLVAVVQCLSGTITAPTGWSTAVNTGALANPVAIFYKENISGGITSVAASLSGSVRWLMAVEEWSGVATSGALDKTATATGTSASPVSGTTATTTVAKELLVALIGIGNADTLSSPTNSFTLQGQATNGAAQALGMLHRVVSSTGSYSAGATSSGVDPYSGVIATFKAGTSDTTISVDYGRLYVDTTRLTYEVAVRLDADPGYVCACSGPHQFGSYPCPAGTPPIPRVLTLNDGLGDVTLTWNGNSWVGSATRTASAAFATATIIGSDTCGGGTGAVGTGALGGSTSVLVRFTFGCFVSGGSFGLTIDYPACGTSPCPGTTRVRCMSVAGASRHTTGGGVAAPSGCDPLLWTGTRDFSVASNGVIAGLEDIYHGSATFTVHT